MEERFADTETVLPGNVWTRSVMTEDPMMTGDVMPETLIQRVVAAVIRQNDLILICRRPLDKRHGGLWEFPGGKVEPGENDHAAISRELEEELNLSVLSTGRELATFRDPGSNFHVVFLGVQTTGDPVAQEHSEIAWVPTDRLLAYPLAPTDRRYVEETLLVEETVRVEEALL